MSTALRLPAPPLPTARTGDTRRVLPGGFLLTGEPEAILVTVLGSCVSACIRNPKTGFGGLNHFMLPESEPGEWNGVGAACRYGNFAMEALINEVLKSGCQRRELEVKLFGGASMRHSSSTIGQENSAFALAYLAAERIPVVASDMGGTQGRRIHYCPFDGKVQRLLLHDPDLAPLASEEARYRQKLRTTRIGGDVDFFE
jgi:chemotaxis protein CheD